MPSPRAVTYRAAVLEALVGEMRRDGAVIMLGEDIGAAGGVFKQTEGLFAEFGAERVIDTPISESGAFGMAVGAAMTGQRPVFELMFGDFLTLIMDQLVNQAAKIAYMSAGQFRVPLVVRTAVGVGGNLGPQHSQSLHAWPVHIPGLKVVMPSTPADAKGLMAAAIRDDSPVVFFEDRMLYNLRDAMPEGDHVVPIGSAAVKREGRDVTIIAVSRMVHTALAAAELLAKEDISAEVVDPRSLVPLDIETLVDVGAEDLARHGGRRRLPTIRHHRRDRRNRRRARVRLARCAGAAHRRRRRADPVQQDAGAAGAAGRRAAGARRRRAGARPTMRIWGGPNR